MNQNPFTLSFGKEPLSFIARDSQNQEIIDSFTSDNPGFQACIITGVRGSGKTVAMTSIANELASDKRWIVVNLNPELNLLNQLAAELSNRKGLIELFKDAKINLSVLGFGLEIDGEPPVTDIVVALRRMLAKITKEGKRVLVTVDEASSTPQFREFASQFQIFMREGLSVFLLMTGLYENISALQDSKNLTFLYRAPKLELKPLSIVLIARKYKDIFNLSDEEALAMANATKGYSFAFQALGYICWQSQKPWREMLTEYDAKLEDFVYEKIWSELSLKDRIIIHAVCSSEDSSVEAIRNQAGIESNFFAVYRNRLLKRGIITSPTYGHIELALPRFAEFAKRQIAMD